jgi:uncharacterized protein YoxC
VVWVLLGVGAATVVVAIALVVALIGRLRSLNESVAELQRTLVPVLADIQRGSQEAQGRMAHLEERAETLQARAGGG